jgi:hypothetical protein
MVARTEGVNDEKILKLFRLVMKYKKIFCLSFGACGPDLVTTLDLRLKQDAEPQRAAARMYPLVHINFMKEFLKKLEEAGCVRKNPNSRWSSPLYVVRKPSGDYRMKIDVRYPNSQIVPVAGVMPMMETVLIRLNGSKFFSSLDAFRGYRQFPLH